MIRIAIVGCGRILNAHLQGFLQLRTRGIDGFRITALVARREDDAWMFHTRGQGPAPRPPVLPPASGDPLAAPHAYLSDFQHDVEVPVFTDYRRMIDAGVADAVLDTTPVFLHHRVGLAALEAGMHVLTQKPLAITVRAARAMVHAARQRARSLGIFENARYRPWVRAARWAFDCGLLGQRQLAVMGALGGLWSPDRIVAQTPWRHDKSLAGAGACLDIGVHHMDILRYIMGEIDRVQAMVRTLEHQRCERDDRGQVTTRVAADVEDTYLATVQFRNQAVGQMMWSWACHGEPLDLPGAPAFFGSRGCIKGNQLILDDGTRTSLLDRFEAEMSAAERDRFFPLGLRDPFAILQYDWLRGIAAGAQDPETGGDEGLRDLAAAYAMIESSHAGRAVSLDEILEGKVDGYQREIDERG